MCSTVAKEKQVVTVSTVKRRYGKIMTLVDGLDKKMIDIKTLAKQLKSKLACGGTFRDSTIELQGDHRAAVKKVLVGLGFAEDSIEVV